MKKVVKNVVAKAWYGFWKVVAVGMFVGGAICVWRGVVDLLAVARKESVVWGVVALLLWWGGAVIYWIVGWGLWKLSVIFAQLRHLEEPEEEEK